MNSLTGLGGEQAERESEYIVWSRHVENGLSNLEQRLSALFVRLEPIRLNAPTPESPEKKLAQEIGAPMIEFLRASSRKIDMANQALDLLMHQIQL